MPSGAGPPGLDVPTGHGEPANAGITTPGAPLATAPAGEGSIRPMVPLGQFRDTFIIAVDDEGIAIVDQHVAHERVLFERITERLSSGRLESQRLLEPMLIDMPASGRQALRAHAADLDRLGFELEEFGGDSLRVAAYPAVLRREECEAAIRALADDLEGLDRGATVADAIRRVAATMACHAAVKANDPLTPEKMAHILDELRRTAYSSICPHGRPVMLRLTRREVERNFQRI
jgi:DNA mismatch repair protein MutL